MKRIYLLMALMVPCLAEPCQAQRLYEHVQHIFAPLNKSEVQSGILIQQSPTFIWPGHYNGYNTADSMRLSLDHFGMLYGQFRLANVDNTDTLPTPDVFLSKTPGLFRQSDTVNLALMAMQYDYIHNTALEDSLVAWSDGQLFDVPGRASSPYVQDTSFVVTALNQNVRGLTCYFTLPSELVFNNLGWNISQVEIDFDDGKGFQPIDTGENYTATYDREGTKTIHLRYTQNGTTLHMVTSVEVEELPASSEYRDYDEDNPEIIDEVEGMTLSIFSACEDGKVRRPLIVLEGFAGENFDSDDMFDLINEGETSSDEILKDYFSTNEYDLIYIDYASSLVSVSANANHLIEAIKWINARKHADGSSLPNVLVGNSMGGLVGKLALLRMHNEQGLDAEVERFFTYDSPLKGANFPIGIQAFIRDLIDQAGDIGASVTSLQQALLLLDSPSSKDLLKHRVRLSYGTNFDTPSLSVNSWDFDSFQAIIYQLEAIRPLGEITRHYAISNGANAGILQESIASLPEAPNLMTILHFYLKLDHQINNDDSANLYDLEITADAYSAINPHILRYERHIAITSDWINELEDIQSEIYLNVSTDIDVDNAPGGNSNIGIAQIKDALDDVISTMEEDLDEYEDAEYSVPLVSFCFVPTVSALDMPENTPPKTPNPTNGSGVFRASMSNDNSSVSDYSGQPEFNQNHVSINTRIADFFVSALSDVIIPNSDLTGPNLNVIYNFGQSTPPGETSTGNIISGNLNVGIGGQLWINRDGPLGYSTSNPDNNYPQSFRVVVPSINCNDDDEAHIEVNDNGKIIIGEWDNSIKNTGHLYFGKNSSLTINAQEGVFVDKYSSMVIGGSSTMTVNSGAKAEFNEKAKCFVAAGGTVTIKSGATFRLINGGELVVEEGGVLEIDAGANIDLWWPESNIHIKEGGELRINGDFNFSGKGYFQFDEGHILSFGPGADAFRLTGDAIDTRFIKLNSGAVLDLENHGLDLQAGLVEFGNASSIQITGGHVRTYEVTFEGSGNSSFYVTDPSWMLVSESIFNDMADGIVIGGFTGVGGSNLFDAVNLRYCTFNECANSVFATNSSRINLAHCTFNGGSTQSAPVDRLGVLGQNVDLLFLHDCNFSDYYSLSEEMAAVYLDNVHILSMMGGQIDQAGTGILAPCPGPSNPPNKSSVRLYSYAIISNCDRAIHIAKGGTDANGEDYGLVDLKCTSLIDNGVGISGVDVLLGIDACVGTDPQCSVLKSNQFILGFNSTSYFDIAYVDRIDVEEVQARYNYWSDDPVCCSGNNFDTYYLAKETSVDNCVSSSDVVHYVNLIDDNALAAPPEGCGSSEPGPETPHISETEFTGTPYQCTINIPDGQYQLDQQYHSATWFFNQDSMEVAYLQYKVLAALPNNIRDNSDQICRHYIDVARVMAYALSSKGSANTNAGGWVEGAFRPMNPDSEELRLKVRPNPASESVQIELGAEPFRLSVYDLLGNLLQITIMSSGETLAIAGWSPGLYLLKAIDETTGEQRAVKLVVGN